MEVMAAADVGHTDQVAHVVGFMPLLTHVLEEPVGLAQAPE